MEKLLGRAVAFQERRDQLTPIISSFIWPSAMGKRVPASAVAHLFETAVGRGKLLACGLRVFDASPEAEYALDQIMRYALGESFAPQKSMSVDQLQSWIAAGAEKGAVAK